MEKFDEIKADIIVDAIIGYSLKNAPTGKSFEFIEWANNQNGAKIALDIPSGVDATTGENYGEYFFADTTLTLALPKTGLSEKKCGELLLSDIGITKNVYEKIGIKYFSPFKREYIIPIFSEQL